MTGLRSFWRLSWMATRTPRARAASRSRTALVAVGVGLVGGDAEVGVEPVEGLLGVADGVPLPRRRRRRSPRGFPGSRYDESRNESLTVGKVPDIAIRWRGTV